MSVRPGDSVRFKVRSDSTDFGLKIYRMGYYGGNGARRVATIEATGLPTQPPCDFDPATGLVDCGNWSDAASWQVPIDAVSGIYFAKLVGHDPRGSDANHAFFIVRELEPRSALLFQTSDTTWQAYNRYGDAADREYSLYRGPEGQSLRRAVKLSYNRPFGIGAVVEGSRNHFRDGWHGVWSAEYPMVRFLERNGYDVSYFSGADTDRFGEEIQAHRVFLSVGHDEYWAGAQRHNVELAREAGIHLAFFSGGEILWKIRWEDGYRTLVCYKEPKARSVDPSPAWTGYWWDRRGTDAGKPGNELTGTLGWHLGNSRLRVPARYGRLRFWRHTEFAKLPAGVSGTTPDNVIGYEWDEAADDRFRPPGLILLSLTSIGRRHHSATLYRYQPSGSMVFGAGTVQWSWGLDGPDAAHRYVPDGDPASPPDRNLQQATVNLLAEMGAQPATLQENLHPAEPSSDRIPPTVSIATPREPARVGTPLVFLGTAVERGNGRIGGVEVSIAGRWDPAQGWERWQYRWVPRTPGNVAVQARAVDDSGNYSVSSAIMIEVQPAPAN